MGARGVDTISFEKVWDIPWYGIIVGYPMIPVADKISMEHGSMEHGNYGAWEHGKHGAWEHGSMAHRERHAWSMEYGKHGAWSTASMEQGKHGAYV